jgi:hypothetical protein
MGYKVMIQLCFGSFKEIRHFITVCPTPICENRLKKQEFQQFHPIFLIFIFLKNNAADISVLLAQVTY